MKLGGIEQLDSRLKTSVSQILQRLVESGYVIESDEFDTLVWFKPGLGLDPEPFELLFKCIFTLLGLLLPFAARRRRARPAIDRRR